MTDHTNDPVGVLPDQKALNDAAWKFIDNAPNEGIPPVLWNNLKAALWPAIQCYIASTTPAAIQHSEQRETVPAGEELETALTVFDMGLSFALCHKDFGATRNAVKKLQADFNVIRSLIAAPVAAPVPEAKAEQSITDSDMRDGFEDTTGFRAPEKIREPFYGDGDNLWAGFQAGVRWHASLSAPVVAEAKAEQVTDAPDAMSRIIKATAALMAEINGLPDNTEHEALMRQVRIIADATKLVAAPAVKHEASELPMGYFSKNGGSAYTEVDPKYQNEPDVIPLYTRAAPPIAVQGEENEMLKREIHNLKRNIKEMDSAWRRELDKRTSVQGSIADDAEFQHRMGDIISALDEDRENGTDAAYDRARSKFISYVNRWADSRSPVAAAPDTTRMDYLEKYAVIAAPGQTVRAAIDAALSAAAPSADAKGNGHE